MKTGFTKWLKKLAVVDLLIFSGFVIAGLIFFEKDAFDAFYHYSRDHESWELDELFLAFMAGLVGVTIIAIRHLFILADTIRQLENANIHIQKIEKEKIEGEKMAAMGELSSGLAHEINNALQPAIGMGEIIKRRLKTLDSEAAEYMDIIYNSSIHARNIVENILLFSRGQKYECEVIDVKETILDAVTKASRTISPGIKLGLWGGGPNQAPFYVLANQTSLQQIIFNLIKNSDQALEGKGQIDVSIQEENVKGKDKLKDGPYVAIHVKDNGCGIDEDVLPYIFDPFFTTKEEGQGTGLGLSVVYGITKNLGGIIEVESHKGLGTMFSVYLPLYIEAKKNYA